MHIGCNVFSLTLIELCVLFSKNRRRLDQFDGDFQWASPQSFIALITGKSVSPRLDMPYSTRGGTSAKILRVIIPSASSSRSCLVSICFVMVGIARCSAPKRFTLLAMQYRITGFHFPPIIDRQNVTGHICDLSSKSKGMFFMTISFYCD